MKPLVDPLELAAVVAHYPGLGAVRAIARNGLSANAAACLVETEGGVFFAKRLDLAADARGEIATEHAIGQHLSARGFPTPGLLSSESGETLIWQNNRAYALFERARGDDRYGDRPVFEPFDAAAEAHAAGAMLARFHLALADFPAPATRVFSGLAARYEVLVAADPAAAHARQLESSRALADYLAWRPAEFDLTFATASAAATPIAPLAHTWPRGILHGDFIKRNLFWEGARIADVVDFDLWNEGPWVFDLALALLPCGFNWPAILAGQAAPSASHLRAMLGGYETVRALEPAERAALPALMETARFEFYQGGIAMALARGDQDLAGRFFGLLRDVTAWFAAHPGWRESAGFA